MATQKEIKQIVVERLKTLPDNVGISIGNKGNLKKSEMIKHVKKGDTLGKKIVKVEMNFLQALKHGKLYET